MTARRVLVMAPPERLRDLAQLIEAWKDAGVRVELQPYGLEMPNLPEQVNARDDLDAVLLVGSARRAPATVLPGPFTLDRGNRPVPIGWLPAVGSAPVRRFAQAAARVHRRRGRQSAVALLGQWHPRYLHIVDRMEILLQTNMRTFRWTSDVVTREGLIGALGTGLGLALYVGHGRPNGWVGYHGLRGHHFDGFAGEPMGAMISLCCRTASRRRTGLSYAESLPLLGVAAASFGATTDTLHTDNTRWATTLCNALTTGIRTIGELIVRAAPTLPRAVAPYRLIGDPLAPVTTHSLALERAEAVPVYP